MSTFGLGDQVRTTTKEEQTGIESQPEGHFDCVGTIVSRETDGDFKVEIDSHFGTYWWSPEDLTLVDEDEENEDNLSLQDLEVGDAIKPSNPHLDNWRYEGLDLSVDSFYTIKKWESGCPNVTDEDEDWTYPETIEAIGEIRRFSSFSIGDKVLHDGMVMEIVGVNEEDGFFIVEGSGFLAKVFTSEIEPVPDVPVTEIEGHEVTLNPEDETFTVGCTTVQFEEVMKLANYLREIGVEG